MIEDKIKALIKEKGLMQKAVAEQAGYKENMFSRMLNGHAIIKDSDVLRIAKALGVTPNELYDDFIHIENDRKVKVRFLIGDKVIHETEPKEIADFIRTIQSPLVLKIKEPDASTVTEDLLKALGGPLQIRESEAGLKQ